MALEDGFLRSLDLGCKGTQPLSLVVDHTGIYYDATEASDLENLLNSSGWETPALLDSARRAMEDIKRNHLSKYNHAPDAPSDPGRRQSGSYRCRRGREAGVPVPLSGGLRLQGTHLWEKPE